MIKRIFRGLTVCAWACWLMSLASWAMAEGTAVNGSEFVDYLAQEKINLTAAVHQSQSVLTPVNEAEYQKLLQNNQALLSLITAKIAGLESFLLNQQTIRMDDIKKIKPSITQSSESTIPSPVLLESTASDGNATHKKIIKLIQDDLSLSERYQQLLQDQVDALQIWKAKQQLDNQLSLSHHQEDRLSALLSTLYARNLTIQKQINTHPDFNRDYLLETKLLLNNQEINFTQYKVSELHLQRQLAKADYLLRERSDIHTLQMITALYQDAINQWSQMEQSLKKIVVVLKKEAPYIRDASSSAAFINFEHMVTAKVEVIANQQKALQKRLLQHQESLKKQLAVRQSFSEYRLQSWPDIFSQLMAIPNQFYTYIKILSLKVLENNQSMPKWTSILMGSLIGLLFIAALAAVQFLKRLTRDRIRSRLLAHIYDGVLILFLKNTLPIAFSIALYIVFYCHHISYIHYELLLNLLVVWLFFRSLIVIARFILLERMTEDDSGHDMHLFLRIKWLLLVGGWTMALMVLSHLLPLSLLLQDLFNRFFMLFLVAVALVVWRSREVIRHLLHPLLKNKKRYIQRAVMMLVILIPMTIFMTAIIGLIGYMNLAWTMSSYQVEILLLLALYVLIRGLMFDGLELLSEWMVASWTNGWLWIEVMLKPLDKLMRLLLILLAIFMVFQLLGWDSHSWVVKTMIEYYEVPLVDLSGIHITPKSMIEFFALLFFFLWAAKWTREFCYRWLYRDAQDNGVRNSLSVFSQYGVIIVGSLITLRALGFDFSGMSMVVGGLAVGMGFGLRDFASNIIGGLMLLIERPVREGDLITIDNYEGKVAHIGIRSMRVCSWDNMEVLIPNAETFNKPFTNWTHQDSIVRTVIPLKVSREDDPVMVQGLIFDVLYAIPEILREPAIQVFLMKIEDALIEFEVRYFINVALHSRAEIRSRVLFAIMARLNAAGVKAPIQPMEIALKTASSSRPLLGEVDDDVDANH